MLTFALVQSMYDSPLGISTDQPANVPEADAGLKLDARIAHDFEYPIRAKEAGEKFAKFRALSKKERNAALTCEVAKLVSAPLAGSTANTLVEMLATQSGANVRAVWTPAEAFLPRLKAGQLNDAMTFILGEAAPKSFTSVKKVEKVAQLAAIFAGRKGIPPLSAEQKRRAEAWLPEGMEIAPAAAPKVAKPAKTKKPVAGTQAPPSPDGDRAMTFENNTNLGRVDKMIEALYLIEKSSTSNRATYAQIRAVLAPLIAALARYTHEDDRRDIAQASSKPAANLTAGERTALYLADGASLRDLTAALLGSLEMQQAQIEVRDDDGKSVTAEPADIKEKVF